MLLITNKIYNYIHKLLWVQAFSTVYFIFVGFNGRKALCIREINPQASTSDANSIGIRHSKIGECPKILSLLILGCLGLWAFLDLLCSGKCTKLSTISLNNRGWEALRPPWHIRALDQPLNKLGRSPVWFQLPWAPAGNILRSLIGSSRALRLLDTGLSVALWKELCLGIHWIWLQRTLLGGRGYSVWPGEFTGALSL